MNTNLELLRKQINEVDKQLIQLVKKRMDVVRHVGIYKKQNDIPPLDVNQWKKVLQSVISLGTKKGLSEKLIVEIYEAIHQEALSIEQKI